MTELILGPRCAGKTTVLQERVREAVERERYEMINTFVVLPRGRASAYACEWAQTGIRLDRILSVEEARTHLRGLHSTRVFIDDVHAVLYDLFPSSTLEVVTFAVDAPVTHLPALH